ncbi:MAG: cytochrome P450, partial [Chloroflexi bacterium]|nr:cytochrome P450 [Chloroflexota bacterium]
SGLIMREAIMTTAVSNIPTAATKRMPPGPHGGWFTGIIPEFRRDSLGATLRYAREYGDVVRLRFGPAETWLLNDPDLIKRVLQEHNKNYKRNDFLINVLKLVSDENLFTSNGEFWLRQRRLMQPAFHRQRIMGFGQIMVEQSQRAMQRWAQQPNGQPLRVDEEMMRIALGIVGRALFSVDLSEKASVFGPAFTKSTEFLHYRFNHLLPMPLFIPTRINREFKQATRTVVAHVDALIAERRRSGEDKGDLLSMLMLARDDETSETMSDVQVRNEASTMIFAGHETTGNTLTWAFYLLSQNPDAEQKLHDELASVLGNRAPTADDLPNLRYTRMVIDESLRLYPPAWAISRQAINADQLGEYTISAKTGILIAPWVTHRDPRWWDNPERFDPERFTPERSANRPHMTYIPFGAGPRMCIGNVFALTEATLVLATIAQQYRLRLAPNTTVEPLPIFTLRVRGGLPMIISER